MRRETRILLSMQGRYRSSSTSTGFLLSGFFVSRNARICEKGSLDAGSLLIRSGVCGRKFPAETDRGRSPSVDQLLATSCGRRNSITTEAGFSEVYIYWDLVADSEVTGGGERALLFP